MTLGENKPCVAIKENSFTILLHFAAKCGFRKVQSASDAKPREASTPRSMPETPDTTTSDDIIPLPSGQTEKTCSPELANVQCHLEVKELWERFNELGTEMIITRSGR